MRQDLQQQEGTWAEPVWWQRFTAVGVNLSPFLRKFKGGKGQARDSQPCSSPIFFDLLLSLKVVILAAIQNSGIGFSRYVVDSKAAVCTYLTRIRRHRMMKYHFNVSLMTLEVVGLLPLKLI